MVKDKPILIDDRIAYHGVSVLRQMNSHRLKSLEAGRMIVLQDGGGNKLAVLVSYKDFMTMQRAVRG